MGLDLLIREKSDFRTDDKGRNIYTTTELTNLRNCWRLLDHLNWKLENGFENCGTHSFYEGTLHKILRELKQELEEEKAKDTSKGSSSDQILTDDQIKFAEEVKQDNINQLQYEVRKLEEFINAENLTEQVQTQEEIEEYGEDDSYGREFEIYAWW